MNKNRLTSLKESMQTQSPSFRPIDLKPAHSFVAVRLAWLEETDRLGSAASTYIYNSQIVYMLLIH